MDDQKAIDNRLATIEGHIRAVREMLAADKPCEQLVVQLLAVEKSIKKVGLTILKNHLNHCIKDSIEQGDKTVAVEFNKILEIYL